MLERQLSSGACAAAEGTRGAAGACLSGSGGHSRTGDLAVSVPLAVAASPSTLAGPTAAAPPDTADAAAQQRSSSAGGGSSGSGTGRLLEAALRMQLEMQRQLTSTMEVRQALLLRCPPHCSQLASVEQQHSSLVWRWLQPESVCPSGHSTHHTLPPCPCPPGRRSACCRGSWRNTPATSKACCGEQRAGGASLCSDDVQRQVPSADVASARCGELLHRSERTARLPSPTAVCAEPVPTALAT